MTLYLSVSELERGDGEKDLSDREDEVLGEDPEDTNHISNK